MVDENLDANGILMWSDSTGIRERDARLLTIVVARNAKYAIRSARWVEFAPHLAISMCEVGTRDVKDHAVEGLGVVWH